MTIDQRKIEKKVLNNGYAMPSIGMGTFGSDKYNADTVAAAVYGAIKCGYRMFDCASVYGNEAEIGKVFRRAFEEGLVKREDLYIVSKVWNDMHGDGDVLLSCAKTLKDLGLGYLDMYYIHWPVPNFHPPRCDVSSRSKDAVPFSVDRYMATWRQMERLVDAGLTRSIGMSNMTVSKLEAVLPLCRIVPAALELELHPAFQQKELFEYTLSKGIVPVGFCPIGSPSRPERDKTPEDVADCELPSIVRAAEARGIHPALVCLKWAFQSGAVPIPFAVTESKYVGNLKCITEDFLTAEEMAEIAKDDKDCRLVKGQVFLWEGAEGWEELWR